MTQTALVPRDFEQLLVAKEDRLSALLAGSEVKPEQFIGMTVQAIARDRKLMAPDIDRESLLLAVLSVAEMGLLPNGAGGAHLVPFNDKESGKRKVQYIVDWRGLIKMALRSGQLRAAWAHPVYEGDEFAYILGDRPMISHKPTLEPSTRGNITHAYAVLHLTNGERVFEVMTIDEIEGIRKRSRAKDAGPWVSDYVEMVRKTPIRRIFKYHPQVVTPQLAAALQAEDDWEDATPVNVTPVSDRRQRLLSHYGAAEPSPLEADPANDSQPSGEAQPDGSADSGTDQEQNGGTAE